MTRDSIHAPMPCRPPHSSGYHEVRGVWEDGPATQAARRLSEIAALHSWPRRASLDARSEIRRRFVSQPSGE